MTETLSHIALRRLNGPSASEYYTPLTDVEVSLSGEGTLEIYAPRVNPERLVTNDVAELLPNGLFRIIGRKDNVICSGGIKMHIEELESALAQHTDISFQITSVPDARLGEAITLLYEASTDMLEELETLCRRILDPYEVPRHFFRLPHLPLTETGKPARAQAKKLAREMMET